VGKLGRLTDKERQKIRDLAGKLPVEEIAAKLGRTVETVERYAAEVDQTTYVLRQGEAEKVSIREGLRATEAWKRLKQELAADEIAYFEEAYAKLMAQLKGNVLPSEETQIFDSIKFEILKSRNMIERRKALEEIKRLEKMQADLLKKYQGDALRMGDSDKEFLMSLEQHLRAARADEQSRTTEFVKLQERHDALGKSLKTTRDQRIKQVESENVNFLGVVKMLNDRDRQAAEGRQMELMRLAGENEYERLGRPTEYEDDSVDNPILSADTVGLEMDEDA
jgi:hypothetical protein